MRIIIIIIGPFEIETGHIYVYVVIIIIFCYYCCTLV